MTNIVMLVHERHRLTEQTLQTLYANTNREQFNLTIVDDCSADFRVRRLLAKYAEKANCTLLRIEKSKGITGQARNLGVYWAKRFWGRGDWLYLSDNDVAFQKDWLKKLIACAQASESQRFRIWGGQVHPFHQLIPPKEGGTSYGTTDMRDGEWTEHLVLDGPSWLLRWSTWNLYGPLDAHAPGVGQSEDGQFCAKLRADGGRIGVIHPHCVIHTGITNSFGKDSPGADLRRQQQIEGVLYE